MSRAINRTRRGAYKFARALGNVEAVDRAIETKSAKPLVKRVARRGAYRFTNKGLARFLRKVLR